jgi:hypothetical protein
MLTIIKIIVQLADSCPCEPNAKWCCGTASHCGELLPATDGNSHCAITGAYPLPQLSLLSPFSSLYYTVVSDLFKFNLFFFIFFIL